MEDFAELGQKIHRRRSKLNYKSFDEFSSDSEEDLLVNVTLDSNYHLGARGKECVHVTTALIRAGKIKIRAADRRICGYHHQKGAPMKEQKAECLTKLFLNIRSHPICKLLLLIHKSFAHYLH